MEYAAESRDTELVEELASWFLKKVLSKLINYSLSTSGISRDLYYLDLVVTGI